MRRDWVTYLFLIGLVFYSCKKDTQTQGIGIELNVNAGQTTDLTFFSDLSSDIQNYVDTTSYELDSFQMDFTGNGFHDVTFYSEKTKNQSSLSFKTTSQDFKFFSQPKSANRHIVKKYQFGEVISENYNISTNQLFIAQKNDSIDNNDWSDVKNQFIGFSFVSDSGYVRGVGWIQLSTSNYQSITIHNWGYKKLDTRK